MHALIFTVEPACFTMAALRFQYSILSCLSKSYFIHHQLSKVKNCATSPNMECIVTSVVVCLRQHWFKRVILEKVSDKLSQKLCSCILLQYEKNSINSI